MNPPFRGASSFLMRHPRSVGSRTLVLALALGAGLGLAGCIGRPATAPVPVRAPDAPEMSVYRTIAESVYVRTTGRSVGIVTSLLDTACTKKDCGPLAARWGLDPLWWADGDSASARAARADLLAHAAAPIRLADVVAGQSLLQAVAPDSAALLTAQPDTAHWEAFKDRHGGAAGFLWFSPIGFDASRRSAIVYVDWQCGPACGHTVAVALRADTAGDWRINDMLLISSRARKPRSGAP